MTIANININFKQMNQASQAFCKEIWYDFNTWAKVDTNDCGRVKI